MSLTPDQVRHIAKLARMSLSDEEVEMFADQLSQTLDYMNILNELDVSQVKPTFQVTGQTNMFREDEVKFYIPKEDLLNCTNLPIERDQIKVKNVFE